MKGVVEILLVTILAYYSCAEELTADDRCRIVPDGVFINNPSSCNAWFQCGNGKAWPGVCGGDDQFDALTGYCQSKEEVDCKQPCEDIEDGTFIDNPSSCSAYYRCQNNKAYAGECPDDLVFDPVNQICEYKSVYQCTEPSPPTVEEIVCQGVPNGVFVNDEQSCDAYYYCHNFVGLPRKCPEGLWFEVSTAECNYTEHITCVESTPAPPNPCDGAEHGEFIDNPASCGAYYQCVNGKPVPGECRDGLHFNAAEKVCEDPEKSSCVQSKCHNIPENSFINDESGCAKYFQCRGGEAISLTCPEGYYFNEAAQLCDHPQNFECSENGGGESGGGENGGGENGGGENGGGENGGGENGGGENGGGENGGGENGGGENGGGENGGGENGGGENGGEGNGETENGEE